jgi:sirohydrochlorin cobaltochelatase
LKKSIWLVALAFVVSTFFGILNMSKTYAAEQTQPEKKAILVCSFGTTFAESRKATIEAIENKVRAEYPDWEVRRAFSSHIIIKVLKERDGINVDTPEQAMQKLADDGYTSVAVMVLDVIPGVEYDYDKRVFDMWKHKGTFQKLSLGLPLFYYMGQKNKPDDFISALNAYKTELPSKLKNDEAVLIMAHGTPHPANAYYTVMQDKINKLGWKNTWVYTVEGTPTLEDVIPQLKAKKIKKVTLFPIMMVAGDHANNDMAGNDKDSHKNQLIAAGFQVETYVHGIGENVAIQDLYLQRLKDTIADLDKPVTPKKMSEHK